jgi:hypothetical protein
MGVGSGAEQLTHTTWRRWRCQLKKFMLTGMTAGIQTEFQIGLWPWAMKTRATARAERKKNQPDSTHRGIFLTGRATG